MAFLLHEKLDDQTTFASAARTVTFNPPQGARGAIFYWRLSAVAGTTPSATVKLQHGDATSATFTDIDNGISGALVAAGTEILILDPVLPADTTSPVRHVRTLLSATMAAVFAFDRAEANETYTYTLSVDWIA
ncbi:MAG TPA: hypothetical protein VJP78_08650 [Thermoleophilia bacterium]|nr:hypothetical protein [Thermoleophilia bacterium]